MNDGKHPFFPEGYARPVMVRSLHQLDVKPDMPGYVVIRRTWKYRGMVCYGEAIVDGKEVPLFRTAERLEPTSWEVVSEESLSNIKRVWGVK